jgi:glycosyltransferase involved in cell wall biosynthesis
VWIGQHSTLPCLTYAQPLLAAAAARLPGLSLKVICNRFPTLDQITVLPRVWSSETEANEIASADIGVSWLPDDPWSQGKCGLKVLQYMAAGLPVVANPVGMNRQMIVHGENGYLAESAEDWAGAIARLAADPALRQRMGAAGRAMVEEHYSVRRWASWFAAFIDRVAGQPPHAESHARRRFARRSA